MTESHDLIEEVPRKTKLNYGLGQFANGILNGFVMSNITFFYNQKLGLEETFTGYAWLIFAIWNTLNDPLISYIIDNTRSRLGRRIPYIRYGSIFYAAAFIFSWFPIAAPGDQVGLFFNLIAALFLLDTMFTFVGCCFFSLPNEIAVTAIQRASLTIYSSVFGFVSIGLGLVLPIVLLTGQAGIHPLFGPVIIILAIICCVILFACSYGLKENLFAQEQPHEGFIEGIKETLKNKPFWIIMMPAFVLSMVLPIIQTGILYYIDYIAPGDAIAPGLGIFASFVVVGIIFTMKKLPKWQPKKMTIVTFYLFTGAFVVLFFFGFNVMLAIIPLAVLGFGLAGGMISNGVVMGDAIDNDELITGKRREAIYGGVNALVTKPGISVANWGFLSIITAFGFISPIEVSPHVFQKQPQPFMALIGIMVAMCLLPAAGTFISAIAMRWYPLDGPAWLDKKQYIMNLHQDKERAYLDSLRSGAGQKEARDHQDTNKR
nr:MFS transporter [Candidatus Sigynarchaeota archaeon]